MGRHKKPEPVYKAMNDVEELFLRRKIDYIKNCAERIRMQITFGGRINMEEMKDTANALIEHGEQIKQKFSL